SFPRFFEPDAAFLLAALAARFTGLGAFRAAALTAFFAGAALCEADLRPTAAPMTPPITAPTGPATLPRTAPAAAPAASFEMGGICMFSDDEPDVSVDDGFSSGITSALLQGVKLCSLLFTTYFGWQRLFSRGQYDFISGADAARSVESKK